MPVPFFLTRLLLRSGLGRWLPVVQRLTDGAGPFVHYYSDRLLASPFIEARDLALYLECPGPDVIDLALGAPRLDRTPSASTKLPNDRRGCPAPWGQPELRAAIADHLQDQQGLTVQPRDEVLVTLGAAGAFQVVLEAFVNAGQPVVLFDPCSPLYSLGLRYRRARVRWIPTWLDQGRLRCDGELLIKRLRGARLIVVNSPANPTGGVFASEDLEKIAWWANRRDVLIFNDTVFERYGYDEKTVSIATLPPARARTLTAGSLSKSHGLTAARVGWLAGHRHLIRPCALAAGLTGSFVPTLCQQIALSAFQQGESGWQDMQTEFASRRSYVFERLKAMGLQPAWPAGAFFFWIPVPRLGLNARVFAELLLKSKKVLVCPGDFFGPGGANHFRLSYAEDDGRVREGLSRLAEFLRERMPAADASRAAA